MNTDATLFDVTLYKIGGSLLDWNELSSRLHQLRQQHSRAIFVFGGGQAADAVRGWDTTFLLGESASHELALRSLDLTARLGQQLLPDSQLAGTVDELQRTLAAGRDCVLLVRELVEELKPQAGFPFSETWETTSDSLALWLACQFGIGQLELVKSTDWPAAVPLSEAAALGLVDAEFARLDQRRKLAGFPLRITWRNLRSDSPAVICESH